MKSEHWLKQLLDHMGERPAGFARSIGLKRETTICNVLSGKYNLSPNLARMIKEAYPEVRMSWLMTGEGHMFEDIANKEDLAELGIYTTYLVPQNAMGGKLPDIDSEGATANICETFISPISNVDLAITVQGESMAPEYPNGSIVLLKRINHNSFIEWGKTYVLDTCNGTIVKNVHKSNDDDKITCRSINPKYDDFDVPKEDIRQMFKVLMCLSSK